MTTTTTTVTTATTTPSSHSKKWLPRLFQRQASQNLNADIISTHTDDREGDTEFFASLEFNTELAFLDHNEIQTGELLGKGTFTVIKAVVGITTAPSSNRLYDKRRQEMQASVRNSNEPRYAIKQLTAETLQSTDPKTVARAARELVNDAKYLSRLSHHANIVSLRGITNDAFGHNYLAHQFQDFFLLTDRVRPQTLHDKIYNEWRGEMIAAIDEPDEDLIPIKANYAFQIAKALRYCHEQGVLYRDLKPTNIGFSWDDPHCIQLLEFGLARDIPKTYSSGSSSSSTEEAPYRMTLAGTRRYLAGEVLTSGEYTWKSDVYSWAMVYYEMCTERKPYHGLTAPEHQLYVCEKGERPVLQDYYLPESLDVILTQAWHPQLDKRWSMEQICTAMLSFLMQLDIGYYQQEEGDFLFDIDPTPIAVESWTEEFGGPMPEIIEHVDQPLGYGYLEETITTAEELSYEDTGMKTSDGNQSRRASMASTVAPVTPCKIISSAA